MPDERATGARPDARSSEPAEVPGAPRREFIYGADILRELGRHGVHPTPHTPPKLVREFVRELYKFEIRRLRDQMIRTVFPRTEYALRVDALRRQYPVLALLPDQFAERAARERTGEKVDGSD